MAIQKIKSTTLFTTFITFFRSQGKYIALCIIVLAVIMLSFFGHKLWIQKKERSAQYDFGDLMIEYDTISREKDPQWSKLLEKFEEQFKNHSHSSLLPYYLGYKVILLLNQDKRNEAIVTLNDMITHMEGSPIIALYETERALIQLDDEQIDIQNMGLEALKNLAFNDNNPYRDSAQYYLGRYYWSNDQISLAREVWQKLVDEQRDEKIAPSPWAHKVQEYLALIIV
ncbi:MAG TPA: hypothetical protein VLB80_04320 [Candidatus Babeliales bacterium]|nr:hypothetical protein [Candidatus Babeliales bacterium]